MTQPGEHPRDEPTPRQRLRRAPADRVPNNVFFTLLIPATFVFCGTILMYVMAGFGDPAAPINRVVDRYAFVVLIVEAGIVIAIGLIAMTIDRRRALSRRHLPEAKESLSPPACRFPSADFRSDS